MIRRGSIVFIVVMFIGLAALAYYLQQRKSTFVASPYSVIPTDAGILVELVDIPDFFESLVHDNQMVDELSLASGAEDFCRSLEVTDSLLHTRDIQRFTGKGSVLVSFHLLGRDRVTAFYAAALPPEVRPRHINEALANIKGATVTTRDYEGSQIWELSIAGKKDLRFSISFVRGLIIVSRSELLVEAAIRQSAEETGIRDMPGFEQVASAAGKNENKLFLIFPNLPRIVSILTGDGGKDISEITGDLASTAESDIFLRSDGIMATGYIEVADSSETMAKYLNGDPSNFESYLVIPAGAAMFESLIGNYTESKKVRNDNLPEKYLADIVRPQLDGEATKIYMDIKGFTPDENRLFIIRLKGSNAIEKAFGDEIGVTTNGGSGEEGRTITYKPDDQSEYTIYVLPGKGMAGYLYSDFGKDFSSSYATFYDNWLVLGKRTETISKFIYDNILNNTLANDLSYRDFEGTMPSRAGYYFYAVPSRILSVLSGRINENILKGLEENINSLQKIEAVGYQFIASNNMIYNTLSVAFSSKAKEETSTQWESLLDTVLYSKPMFFTNHNTGRNEIFIQDLNNNIYLINSAGRILWKVKLAEKIVGDPYMIDYYRNGKNQILFATANYLHLIDRNGNYVERFPVRLRSQAASGLSVFDYDNNKDYRLFIAGVDRQIYAYDKSGNVVKGWNLFRTKGEVHFDIEFFRVSGKDYLVVNDDENMYILDRRGNIRVSVNKQIDRAPGSRLRLTGESSPRLVLSSGEGTIIYVSFSGNVEEARAGYFSSDHIFEYFDIDGDGLGEYFFIDKGDMTVYDDDLDRMFSVNLGQGEIIGPYGLVFSQNDRMIGLVEKQEGLIRLFDSRGKSARGFPLRGSSAFSVGKFSGGSSFNLITGGNDSFLYNYEITK